MRPEGMEPLAQLGWFEALANTGVVPPSAPAAARKALAATLVACFDLQSALSEHRGDLLAPAMPRRIAKKPPRRT
jgi:hypothetical protein